jgi:hypothetical protein
MSLDRLLGSWDLSMHHVAVPDTVTGHQSYRRVLDDAFVMLTWRYDHPDFPDAIVMLEAGSYHYFDVRGITREYDFSIDDAGWTILRRDEDFWQRSAVRFVGQDAMEGTGENSFDQGSTWQHDYSIEYTRVE